VLLNVSPEIRQQLESYPPLAPRTRRGTGIAAIVLTNGDLDHTLGLFSLRESTPLAVYATRRVRDGLVDGNTIYRTLERFPGQIQWRELPLASQTELRDVEGRATGLVVETQPIPGKLPLHLEGLREAHAEDNIGVRVREAATGRTASYLPAVGAIDDHVERLLDADAVLFDGTFFDETELIDRGLAQRPAAAMAHLPIGGADGSLARLGRGRGRRIYTHINNTNPILVEDSSARRRVGEAGWEVAYDGLELELK
jgi:pyrroloquinoline quinone biosynthesis protein B